MAGTYVSNAMTAPHLLRATSVFWIAMAAVLLPGCATMVNTHYKTVTFSSEPAGATVWIDTVQLGQTPVTYDVPRRPFHVVRFVKEGYKPLELNLEMNWEGKWLLPDFFTYGWIVDMYTEAWYNWEFPFVNGVMEKE